jgi:ribonuclease HI
VPGGGGVIYDPRGQKEHQFSWGLGCKTNNQDEVMAAFKGLSMIPENKTQSVIVLGDSEIVMKQLRGISHQNNSSL